MSKAKRGNEDKYIDFSKTKRILVFDLGGGTCDTSVIDVQVDRGEFHFTEVGIGRYQELGGIDFDAKLAEGLLNAFFQKNNILQGDISEVEMKEMYKKLLLVAESIKEKLSGRIYAKLSMDPNTDIEGVQVKHNVPNFYQGKTYSIVISKAEYSSPIFSIST